jgi:hypothetical protein
MTQYIDESMEKSVTKFVTDEPELAQEQNTNSSPTSEIVKEITNGQPGAIATGLLKEVLDSIERVNRLARGNLLEPHPLIYYKDHPIFLVNEQSNISAFTGSFKSRLINFFAACMVQQENNKFDFYGFRPNPKYKDSLVIIADTEQNEGYAVPKRIQLIEKVAGYSESEVAPRLVVVPLRKFGHQMKNATEALLREYRQLNPETHIVLIIDVVTGFVSDFLDSKSNQDFIMWINESMAKLNCTIITTIHAIQTEGGATKSKGHTGSLIDNNSSLHYYISKVKNKFFDEKQVYKLALKKDREGQEKDIFYFCYDPDYFIKVLQDEEIEEHGIRVSKRTDQDIINDLHSHFGFKEFRLKNDGELDQKLCFIYDTRNYGTITKKLKELLDKKFKIDKTSYFVKLISRKDPNDSRGKIFQLTQEQPAANLNFDGHD